MSSHCCYKNAIDGFLKESQTEWLQIMQQAFIETNDLPLGESQVRAWKDCYRVLQDQLPPIDRDYPAFQIVFEYRLPYESGRRPDVLLISQEQVEEISSIAKSEQKHVVAFVTGVPGAGKTFLGLQYVYDICKDYENVTGYELSSETNPFGPCK